MYRETEFFPIPRGTPASTLPPHIPVSMQQPEGCLKHKPDPRHSRSWPAGLPPPWKAIPVQPHPWPDSLPSSTFLKFLSPLGPCRNNSLTSSCNSLIATSEAPQPPVGMLSLHCLGFQIPAPALCYHLTHCACAWLGGSASPLEEKPFLLYSCACTRTWHIKQARETL